MGLHVRVCKSQTNTHTDPAAVNRKHMHIPSKSLCVLGRISMYKIQKKKYRVWVDSDTATDHSFKKIII